MSGHLLGLWFFCVDFQEIQPVSNLSFMSKILEKVVACQLLSHQNRYNLFSGFQSAYCPGHSTETALFKVVKDPVSALDLGKFLVLVLLDLSAAFDTVDHDILLHCLHHVFGIQDKALSWFKSYLTNSFQMVSIRDTISDPVELCYGVPQDLFLDLFLSFSIDSLSLMSFLTIQFLTCCMLMTCR